MAKIRCPQCGYTEDDARPHDRETYLEVCVSCKAPDEHSASRRLDVLERDAPHLIAPIEPAHD